MMLLLLKMIAGLCGQGKYFTQTVFILQQSPKFLTRTMPEKKNRDKTHFNELCIILESCNTIPTKNKYRIILNIGISGSREKALAGKTKLRK